MLDSGEMLGQRNELGSEQGHARAKDGDVGTEGNARGKGWNAGTERLSLGMPECTIKSVFIFCWHVVL